LTRKLEKIFRKSSYKNGNKQSVKNVTEFLKENSNPEDQFEMETKSF